MKEEKRWKWLGLAGGWHWSRDQKEVRGQTMGKSRGRAFQAKESASAKVLRQEGSYSVHGIAGRPVWLELRVAGEGVGEITGGARGLRVTVRPLAFPLNDRRSH